LRRESSSASGLVWPGVALLWPGCDRPGSVGWACATPSGSNKGLSAGRLGRALGV